MEAETKPENPRAFPVDILSKHSGQLCGQEEGMSLRDYFAGKAIQAFLSQEYFGMTSYEGHAKEAYELADAMLKERSKP